MFAALERLGDESLTPEQLKNEIARSKAISDVGKVIVESAKTELLHAKLTRKKDLEPPDGFLEIEEPKKIERPKAEYSNNNHHYGTGNN